jgi:hypothetical protein
MADIKKPEPPKPSKPPPLPEIGNDASTSSGNWGRVVTPPAEER